MASGMNWFPNRDAVLYFIEQIWPLIGARHPDARVTIVGASPPQAVLDLAARDSRVTVTGFVQDVRPYLDRAQVYLCPMRDGGGTRLKILDSLSMGKAIVATTMALEGIDVRPETEVLVGDTPEAFAAQVGRIIAEPELGRRLGTSARDFVTTRFAWPVIGDHLERTFRGIASTHANA
jgi:glycosyltransferase involved in cell wall biosynthesis